MIIGASYFRIGNYSSSNTTSATNSSTMPDATSVSDNVYLGLHGGLVSAVFITGLLQALFYAKSIISSAERLHNKMFAKLLRTPIKFFDTHPSGTANNNIP